ncbi:MAG: DUF5685 family protein [Oscillospiraceae bacterium]|nr:DUF5685 family protein [Oscillospiraceae bacterium]
MFGYVKPFKPEMKICEFEAYKSVYCGLCKRLGRSFGPLARFTLGYDFTFLSILHLSLSKDKPVTKPYNRINPFCRTPPLQDCASLAFGANVAAIMLYYKLLDNIADSGPVKSACWRILLPFAGAARKKAAVALPEADGIVQKSIEMQSKAEKAKTKSLDEAGEAFAFAMSEIFLLLPESDTQSRVLSRLGYLIGRYVYVADALDDLNDDIKQSSYNPLIERFGIASQDAVRMDDAIKYAHESLYMTIGEITKAYDLLTISSYGPVLDNILYLGLYKCADEIMRRKE